MNRCILYTKVLLLACLVPVSASATLVFSDAVFTAATSASTQTLPTVTNFDSQTIPPLSSGSIQALSRAAGIAFPNLPNSVGSAFASAAQLILGTDLVNGVGVNGFFSSNSLPPNTLEAATTLSQTIINNSTTDTETLTASFFVPAPTMQFFGVGNFFPAGIDPARDAFAFVQARLSTILTHPDGSVVQDILLDYGMRTFREPVSGVFGALPISSDSVGLTRFDAPDGSFGFRLPDLFLQDISFPDLPALGPGDMLQLGYDFFATASTGFGETGVFAAIGDPFDLRTSGGRFEIQAAGEVAPGPGQSVPLPATWTLLVAGMLALRFGPRGRARGDFGKQLAVSGATN